MQLAYCHAAVRVAGREGAKWVLNALLASTRDEYTRSALGQFGGLYAVPGDVESPVLVSSAD